MPTKRRKIIPQRVSLPPGAVEAWKARDWEALRRLLRLRPWEPPLEQVRQATPPADPVRGDTLWETEGWSRIWALRQALVEAARADKT